MRLGPDEAAAVEVMGAGAGAAAAAPRHGGGGGGGAGGRPGGGAWVIQKCGADVLSVDRSSLDEKISSLKGVSFEKRDAFSLLPKEFEKDGKKVDWFFSDVICYPEKLYNWLSVWVDSGVCKNFICTIKFTGEPDP